MSIIPREREIIDREALTEELAAAARRASAPTFDRAPLVAAAKARFLAGHGEVRRRFETAGDGAAAMRAQCFLIDELIRALYDAVNGEIYPLANPTKGE